ncbi:MAG TPA: DUF488 family protein [bacterium]|nr:DUF488 family protein [bacterium]
MAISVKRVYDPPVAGDGLRVLVDRLWPRGLSKAAARIDLWVRDLSPSHELRQWYAHDPEKWTEFKRRYFTELAEHAEALAELAATARRRQVTLLFGSRELRRNNACALKEALQASTGNSAPARRVVPRSASRSGTKKRSGPAKRPTRDPRRRSTDSTT